LDKLDRNTQGKTVSIWKNKHVVIASLMAPLLGLLSYFAVNMLVSEQPSAAQPGQSYMLVEKPNCRYASGKCGLKNAEFELELSFERLQGNRLRLNLSADHALDGVLLAQQVNNAEESTPRSMNPSSADGRNWSLEISNPDPENQRLRLVASANAAYYVGDAALKFTILE
jgi:hypothetical protein